MWGKITSEMDDIIRFYVEGEEVHDLGGGDGRLARKLVQLGSRRVIVYDKEVSEESEKVDTRKVLFNDLSEELFESKVLFISWPPNNYSSNQLSEIIKRAKLIIYLGFNFDCTACGSEIFYRELYKRELLEYIPNRKNNLLIVGSYCASERLMTPEEMAGLCQDRIFRFEEEHKGKCWRKEIK
jgi:hypothetical protein